MGFLFQEENGVARLALDTVANPLPRVGCLHGPADLLLVALPEARDYGQNTDTFTESVSAAFFVLAKINGPARTAKLADETYLRLLEVSQAILDKLEEYLTGGGAGMPCPLLAGLSHNG